uniref:Variant surface glycoprotein 1125.530 n=1 Tax=Trypanosoma brucei TaxID=5691 RepID=A0A1J0R616_9TRYP|nr:variant surface glycoprotein 1125.530 [Trypanosoma brucei]
MAQGASLLAVLMLLGGAVSQVAEATYKMPLKSTGWQPLCDIGAALVAKSAQAAAVSKAQRNRARNLLQQQLRAEITASTVDDEETEKRFFTIAFYLKQEAVKALNDLTAPGETANTKTVRATNFALGHLREFMVIATGGTTSCQNGCISQHASNGADPVVGYAQLATAYGNCAALDGSPITGFDPSTVVDNKGLKKITTTAGNTIAATEKHCRLLTTAANEGYADDDTAGDTVNMAGGLLKVTSNAAVNFNAHDTLTGAAAAETKIMKAAFDAIKEIPAKPADYTNKDINELKTDANFHEAFKAIYNVEQAKTGATMEVEIERAFPAKGTPFAQQIWDKIRDTKLPYALAEQPENTKIGTIEDIEILVKIINNFTGEKLKRENEAEKKQTETKCNTEATQQMEAVKCSTLDKPECKPDLGCKYNETRKACENEPKPAVAKTNQESGKTDISVKCSDYDTKDKCEAVNKDGKKHCGWRKGKDDENDKETEKCRNGSFLVNKKFFLSMAAAFLSFLFKNPNTLNL